MISYTARKVTLALALVVLAASAGRTLAQSTTAPSTPPTTTTPPPATPDTVTGTDPEPQDGFVEGISVILQLA
jgi:hypothetical protein